jgi:hypothetical protein
MGAQAPSEASHRAADGEAYHTVVRSRDPQYHVHAAQLLQRITRDSPHIMSCLTVIKPPAAA